MTLRYLNEKSRNTMALINGNDGTLQSKIVLGYRDSLRVGIDNAENDQYLPAELMTKLTVLKLRLESWDDQAPMPIQGPIWYNVEQLPYREARNLADEIVGICREVSDLYGG
jgi:hypothetical protein